MSGSKPIVDDPAKRALPARMLGSVFAFVLFLLSAVIGNVGLEVVGVAAKWWPTPGAQHAQDQVDQEVRYITSFVQPGSAVMNQANVATKWVYTSLWSYTGMGWILNFANRQASASFRQADTYFNAAEKSVQLVAVRAVIGLMTLPAYLLVALLAVVDGLILRDVRRFTGAPESSLVFAAARGGARMWFTLPWVLYIANPWSIHPNWIFGPALLLFGLTLGLAVAKFKKVL